MKNILLFAFLLVVSFHFSCKKSDPLLSELQSIKKSYGVRFEADEENQKALAVYKKKDYKTAEKLWYETAKKDPSWGKPYFNLACVNALMNKKDVSLEYIDLALSVDPTFLKFVQADADLKSIRDNEKYNSIIDKYQKKYNETIKKDAELKKRIIGTWQLNSTEDTPVGDTFVFYANGTYDQPYLRDDNFELDYIQRGMAWKIQNSVLLLTFFTQMDEMLRYEILKIKDSEMEWEKEEDVGKSIIQPMMLKKINGPIKEYLMNLDYYKNKKKGE